MDPDVVINNICNNSIFVPLITGIVFFKRIRSPFKLLLYLVITGALVEILYTGDNDIHKLMLNVYTFVEFAMLTIIYRTLLKNRIWKKVIAISASIVLLIFGLNFLFFQGIFQLNSYSMAGECIFLIIVSALLFYQMMSNISSRSLFYQEQFWFNSGVFLYFSINFFVFLFSDAIYGKLSAIGFWHIHNFGNLLLNISFAISLFLSAKGTFNFQNENAS